MKQATGYKLFLVLCALLVVGVVAREVVHLVSSPGPAPRTPEAVAMTAAAGPAPAFSLVDRQGKPHTLEDLRGRHVFLNLWATWCPPCVEELPSLVALHRHLSGRPIVFVTSSVDESWEIIDKFLETIEAQGRGAPGVALARRTLAEGAEGFLVLLDEGGEAAKRYGTTKFPETFLIAPDGTLAGHFVGPRDWTHPAMLRFFDELLPAPAAGGAAAGGAP